MKTYLFRVWRQVVEVHVQDGSTKIEAPDLEQANLKFKKLNHLLDIEWKSIDREHGAADCTCVKPEIIDISEVLIENEFFKKIKGPSV